MGIQPSTVVFTDQQLSPSSPFHPLFFHSLVHLCLKSLSLPLGALMRVRKIIFNTLYPIHSCQKIIPPGTLTVPLDDIPSYLTYMVDKNTLSKNWHRFLESLIELIKDPDQYPPPFLYPESLYTYITETSLCQIWEETFQYNPSSSVLVITLYSPLPPPIECPKDGLYGVYAFAGNLGILLRERIKGDPPLESPKKSIQENDMVGFIGQPVPRYYGMYLWWVLIIILGITILVGSILLYYYNTHYGIWTSRDPKENYLSEI